jgi:hypothetical protein
MLISSQKYIEATEELDKNWEFIKMHLQTHLFDDIEAKGATQNYNTKPNEKLHGLLRKSYQRQTNFKNVADQVSHLICM